jgi:DNA-binding response OmpR family regulator
MKILIAEDDLLSRMMLEKSLERAGYEVIAVDDGLQALSALDTDDPPRLALLDWMMPEKDGAEVCRTVRCCRERAYTYLILLSSKEAKQDIVQGLEAGADDYLTKPYDEEELKARLRAGGVSWNLRIAWSKRAKTCASRRLMIRSPRYGTVGSSLNCCLGRLIGRGARRVAR